MRKRHQRSVASALFAPSRVLGVVVLEQHYMSILQLAAAFLVILIVLMFRPSGLFGTRKIERV